MPPLASWQCGFYNNGAEDFDYFAVQASGFCFCGKATESGGLAPDFYGAAPPNSCVNFCSGRSDATCGGSFVNSIYRLNRTEYNAADVC